MKTRGHFESEREEERNNWCTEQHKNNGSDQGKQQLITEVSGELGRKTPKEVGDITNNNHSAGVKVSQHTIQTRFHVQKCRVAALLTRYCLLFSVTLSAYHYQI